MFALYSFPKKQANLQKENKQTKLLLLDDYEKVPILQLNPKLVAVLTHSNCNKVGSTLFESL